MIRQFTQNPVTIAYEPPPFQSPGWYGRLIFTVDITDPTRHASIVHGELSDATFDLIFGGVEWAQGLFAWAYVNMTNSCEPVEDTDDPRRLFQIYMGKSERKMAELDGKLSQIRYYDEQHNWHTWDYEHLWDVAQKSSKIHVDYLLMGR
jgi:hypothetical protein